MRARPYPVAYLITTHPSGRTIRAPVPPRGLDAARFIARTTPGARIAAA